MYEHHSLKKGEMLVDFPFHLLKPVQSKEGTVVGASKRKGEAYEISKRILLFK